MTIKKNFSWNSSKYKYFVFLFIFSLILAGCQSNKKNSQSIAKPPASNDDFFQTIGQQIGLDFVHSIGGKHLDNIVESVGGGAAFLDYDQDGYIDLYTCSGTWIEGFTKGEKPAKLPENHLYHNQQNGTFEDVTGKAGVGGHDYSMGVTVGDFNNDGYPDIYVSNYGPNTLYKNNKNG
ncbi:MAG: VCBS repeat-containing protein, partial [Bacteroidales bacterium]|nr:VCBS repeat-containing protein [Bacteroidales bacterium]